MLKSNVPPNPKLNTQRTNGNDLYAINSSNNAHMNASFGHDLEVMAKSEPVHQV